MFDVGDRIIGLELPDTFYKLAELLEQDQFELLLSKNRIISYFKHAGQDDFLALGVAVVDVGQAQDRTTLLVDEAARRVGFDVQIRYTRIDERETASIEKIKI